MKQIIGITGTSQFTPLVREMVNKFYGAIALDINQNGTEDLTRIASMCSSFVFAGGVDIYPLSLEHEKREVQRNCGYSKFDRMRDKRELELIKIAETQDKKIFGICRGHQMLLSHAGLSLIPDITHGEVCHNPRDIEVNDEPIHYVEGIGLGIKEFGEQKEVNSFHHQAIAFDDSEPTPNESAKAIQDSFNVEVLGIANVSYGDARNPAELIVELARGKNFLSCQWHPENDWETNEASLCVLEMFKRMIS